MLGLPVVVMGLALLRPELRLQTFRCVYAYKQYHVAELLCDASNAAPYAASAANDLTTGTPSTCCLMSFHTSLAAPPPDVYTCTTFTTTELRPDHANVFMCLARYLLHNLKTQTSWHADQGTILTPDCNLCEERTSRCVATHYYLQQ